MPISICRALAALAFFCCVLGPVQSRPAEAANYATTTEYAMIRFDGLRFSQIVWPDGRVEFMDTLAPEATARPDNLDERIYVLTILMNKLSKQGYEFVELFSQDQVLMKRVR
jgi:hypothetical protein